MSEPGPLAEVDCWYDGDDRVPHELPAPRPDGPLPSMAAAGGDSSARWRGCGLVRPCRHGEREHAACRVLYSTPQLPARIYLGALGQSRLAEAWGRGGQCHA